MFVQYVCIQTNKMHKIPVIRLYFPLDALHVSDCISPSSGATLKAVHRVWYMPVYTKCDVQLIKVAPDDGII